MIHDFKPSLSENTPSKKQIKIFLKRLYQLVLTLPISILNSFTNISQRIDNKDSLFLQKFANLLFFFKEWAFLLLGKYSLQ